MDSDFVAVFFDLETTGGADDDEIIQIGAVTKQGINGFNTWVVPTIDIPEEVTDLTGYEKVNDVLYYEDEIMDTVPLEEALQEFLEYLQTFNKPVILVAHGAFASDCRFIIKYFNECELLDELSEVVQGFCDSLPLFEKYLPNMNSYRLGFLVKKLVRQKFDLHDALEDSKALAAIFRTQKLRQNQILEFSRSFNMIEQGEERRIANKNLRSLQPLRRYLPPWILKKMASDNLDLYSLQECLCVEGRESLINMLSEPIDNDDDDDDDEPQPRITDDMLILEYICDVVNKTL